MKKDLDLNNNKGITLIALVITIVILIILAAVVLNTVLGENGIIARAKQAVLEHKKAQYYEEIGLEILEEQTERFEKAKEEAFIVSINERLTGQKQASSQTVSSYAKKSWIESTTMCDEEKNIHTNPFDNNRLYVYTTEGYELIIIVNNQSLTASIEEGSFQKTADKVNVTYNANDGTGSMEGQSTLPGFKVTLKENEFTKNKYTFTGWCFNQDGSGDKYQPGSDLRITEDCTLYAVWSINTVTISFDPNTGEGEMAQRNVDVDATYQLTKNTFTKEGYTFSKWTTNADGTGDEYADEGDIAVEENTTLYAQWTPETYTITYALSGGSITGEKTSYTIEDADFVLASPTKDGYTFAGWTGTGLNSATTSVTVSTGSMGARAYTATWSPTSYTITYDLDGGTGVSNRTYTIEDSFTLPIPSKSNYDFAGWTGSNGNTPQTEVTISVGTTGDKSYTANWQAATYTITYKANGGTGNDITDTFHTGDTFTLRSYMTYSKDGCISTSWNEASNGSGTSWNRNNYIGATFNFGRNITLYAQWKTAEKVYIYNAGTFGTGYTDFTTFTCGSGAVSKQTGYYQFSAGQTSNWKGAIARIASPVNVSNYYTVVSKFSIVSQTGNNITGVISGDAITGINIATNAWSISGTNVRQNTEWGGTGTIIKKIDISDITSSYYVGAIAATGWGTITARLQELYFEK